jgi:hypothetical protein
MLLSLWQDVMGLLLGWGGLRRNRAAELQYPRCYSNAGTVHGLRAAEDRRLGLGTPAAGLRPRLAKEKVFPSNFLLN